MLPHLPDGPPETWEYPATARGHTAGRHGNGALVPGPLRVVRPRHLSNPSFSIHLKSTWKRVSFSFPPCHLSRFPLVPEPWKPPTPTPLRAPRPLLHQTLLASAGRAPGQPLRDAIPATPPLSMPPSASASLPADPGVLPCSPHTPVRTHYVPDRGCNSNTTRPHPHSH